MGSLNDDLDILKGDVTQRPDTPAFGQTIVPIGDADRTIFVSASINATVLVSLNMVRAALEVSYDGDSWLEADVGYTSAGALNAFRVLDGHTKLEAFIKPGQVYRFVGSGQNFGGSFSVQEIHETIIEISSHRSVAFEYLSGATPAPDNSHMHECGAPCFTPSLFIDQYKRDPLESYRNFSAGTPPKGYARALAGSGSGGSANPLEDATGNNDLTLVYTDQPAPIPSNISAFNGGRMVDGFHAITADRNFDGLGTYTIDIHISPSTSFKGAVPFAIWEAGFEQVRLSIDASGFVVYEHVESGGTTRTAQGAIDIDDQSDHWVRAVWDGSNITLLIDGVVDATTGASGIQGVGSNAFVVLGRSDTLVASSVSAIGIDELRLSDVARDGGGAYSPINAPFTVDGDTLNLWHFDGDTGVNGDNLLLMNSELPKFTAVGSPAIIDDGPHGKALRVDGDNYIEGPNAIRASGAQGLSYGCWFRVIGAPGGGNLTLISKWNAQGLNTWLTWLQINGASQAIQARWSSAAGGNQNILSTPVAPYLDGQWHYVYVETRPLETTHEMFIDGVSVASAPSTSFPGQNADIPTRIGGSFVQNGTTPDFAVDVADAWCFSVTSPTASNENAGSAVPAAPITIGNNSNRRHFPLATAAAVSGGTSTGNLHVKGRKADDGDPGSFVLNWRGVNYTGSDPEITFPTPTTWEAQLDPGAEVGPPGELLTVSQNGQPDQQVAICIDRTAPTASLALSGMAFGADGLDPMRRGEYAKLLPTYADAGVGISSAKLIYENGGYWTGEPGNAPASGVATAYFRSSSSAPTSGSTDITLRVEDKAGNSAQDSVTVFFGSLPAQTGVSLSDLTGAERPAHLNDVVFTETAYDDRAIGATVNISPVLSACRNSGRDDTSSQLLSAGLAIKDDTHPTSVASLAAIVHTTSVRSQSSKLGEGIKGRVRDQHYRNVDSAEVGDYAFNANRANDFGIDQSVGIGSPPFTGKAAEPFTDEYAGDSLTNCRIFDGAVEWQAPGAVLDVTVALTSNNGQLYQPRLFDKAGAELLFATYGAEVDVKLHDGTTFVGPASGDSFGPNASYDLPALNGAASVQARITVANTSVPPLGAFIMNYKA